jgi:Right handed beta helix region
MLRIRTAAPALAAVGLATLLTVLLLDHPQSAGLAAPSAYQRGQADQARDCAAIPHSCGFPDSTNAGVPAGTQLREVPGQVSSGPGWHYNPRGFVVVDGPGAVLSNLSIPCTVVVTASEVTISEVQVVTSGQNSIGIGLENADDVTVENSTIEGTNTGSGRLMDGIKDVYGNVSGTRVLDNNISQASTGVQIYQGLIRGNYIHNPGMIPADHVNGITTNGDTQPLLVQHNTIFDSFGQTDAIGLFQDFGVVSNVTIDDNLLAGGGYSIYGGEGDKGQVSHIVITKNVFSTRFFPLGGQWGTVAYFSADAPGDVWAGNVWDVTGRPVIAP